jgi:hypothetical protein
MLLLFIVPLSLLGMTPVTLLFGDELTTAAPVALGFTEIGMEATELLTTYSEAATSAFTILSLAFLSEERTAAGAGAEGTRFGRARRPNEGENVFLRPLTARERESCITNRDQRKGQVDVRS